VIVLEAVDLAVTPPGARQPSVRGISLRVQSGEWLALAGENGGGKTSLIHALAGLWPVSSGALTLDREPFDPACRERVAGSLAVVLQDPSSQLLQPTVGEELAFTARNLGTPRDQVAREVESWTHALGLEAELALDPATLSAGRQQLVLLAAALVGRPRLLIADELTAHMDAATRVRVRDAIAREVARGLAVVWATQDADELGVAARTLVVGTAVRPAIEAPAAAQAPARDGAGEGIRLGVLPATAGSGRRIQVERALQICLGRRGVTALLGPNGAGKSVLLAAAAGIEESPQVRVEGAGALTPPPIMALQYPELQVFEELVADEVVFGAVARGLGRADAIAAASEHMRATRLDPDLLLARRTWSLSTGEKRLVEVIGALIAPASLVLLDEPTAGLDPARRAGLARLVVRRAEADPVLVATQDAAWVSMVGGWSVRLGDAANANVPKHGQKRD
jgi:energy-coupling factor transport system ATP-binding protein